MNEPVPKRVPPLLWVRAFEAAARHESFVAAARELSVSAGAVSRLVKQLEAFLGVELFVRNVSGVQLTDVARAYAAVVGPAIREIAVASAELCVAAREQTLRVSAMPALAQRWLVPRLREFNDLHPHITVRVAAEPAVLDPACGLFDVALRYDDAVVGDCERVDLLAEELFPVLSPELAKRAQIRVPNDLSRLTALHDTSWESDWELWFSATATPAPKRWRGVYYTLYAMAVDAAVSGQGVLIGHAALIEEELRAGRLIAPFAERVLSKKRYYALARPVRASSAAARAFMEWIATQARPATISHPHPHSASIEYADSLT